MLGKSSSSLLIYLDIHFGSRAANAKQDEMVRSNLASLSVPTPRPCSQILLRPCMRVETIYPLLHFACMCVLPVGVAVTTSLTTRCLWLIVDWVRIQLHHYTRIYLDLHSCPGTCAMNTCMWNALLKAGLLVPHFFMYRALSKNGTLCAKKFTKHLQK